MGGIYQREWEFGRAIIYQKLKKNPPDFLLFIIIKKIKYINSKTVLPSGVGAGMGRGDGEGGYFIMILWLKPRIEIISVWLFLKF